MNKGEITCIILLDICKAFHMVDHKHLLKQLASTNSVIMPKTGLNLTNIKQVVKVQKC